MTDQKYENYWKLTLAQSDFVGQLFGGYLSRIIAYIDYHQDLIERDSSAAYRELQSELIDQYHLNDASVRKAINQFVKLGFVDTGLRGYHELAKEFLTTTDPAAKMTLFSRIVYDNASFGRSVDTPASTREMNFLIRTLTHHGGILTRREATALMTIDVAQAGVDFADDAMIAAAVMRTSAIDFADRKYNQMSYLWNLLGKLDDLRVAQDKVYFASDPRVTVLDDESSAVKRRGRDSYLQRLYKNELIQESQRLYGAVVCMVERLDYPVLIASHIKPYIDCEPDEAFNGANGLLLGRTLDQLFDGGYISFADDGQIMVSQSASMSDGLRRHLMQFGLGDELLTPQRRVYLAYHRDQVFKR